MAKQLMRLGIKTPAGGKIWHPSSLRQLLTNPTSTGTLYVNREHVTVARQRRSPLQPVGHRESAVPTPPTDWMEVCQVLLIVSQERFEQVQAKLRENASPTFRNNTAHPLPTEISRQLEEYRRRRQELEQRLIALDQQHRLVEAQIHQQMEISGMCEALTAFCQRVQVGLAEATCEQKRQLVELLVDRVIVTMDEVEIRYVIPTSPRSEHIRFCHLHTEYFTPDHDGSKIISCSILSGLHHDYHRVA